MAHIPEWPSDIYFHTGQIDNENKYQRDQLDKNLSITFYRYDVRRIHPDYAIN